MTDYMRLKQIQKMHPELTFNNDGYEYLSPEIKENNKSIIKEIEAILKKHIKGFSRFDNFKPRKDKPFAIRCQYYWDAGFCGVGYFPITDFKGLK